MTDDRVFALASGRAWDDIGHGERWARRLLTRLGAKLFTPSTRVPWSAEITCIVAPAPARSVIWLCASAARTAELLQPSFLVACDKAGALVPSEGHRWADAGELSPPNPRLRVAAVRLWVDCGPPLRGLTVLIVGELRPRRTNVPNSATIAVILRAAGAVVTEEFNSCVPPSFALAPPSVDKQCFIVKQCLSSRVPVFGAAFPTDLIATGEAHLAEYVMFDEQAEFIISELSPKSFSAISEERPLNLVKPPEGPLRNHQRSKSQEFSALAAAKCLVQSERAENGTVVTSQAQVVSCAVVGKQDMSMTAAPGVIFGEESPELVQGQTSKRNRIGGELGLSKATSGTSQAESMTEPPGEMRCHVPRSGTVLESPPNICEGPADRGSLLEIPLSNCGCARDEERAGLEGSGTPRIEDSLGSTPVGRLLLTEQITSKTTDPSGEPASVHPRTRGSTRPPQPSLSSVVVGSPTQRAGAVHVFEAKACASARRSFVRKRRRPPIIAESPPSEDDEVQIAEVAASFQRCDPRPDVSTGFREVSVQYEGDTEVVETNSISPSCLPNRPGLSTPSRRLKRRKVGLSFHDESIASKEDSPGLNTSSPRAHEISRCATPDIQDTMEASSPQVPLRHRVRLRTPRNCSERPRRAQSWLASNESMAFSDRSAEDVDLDGLPKHRLDFERHESRSGSRRGRISSPTASAAEPVEVSRCNSASASAVDMVRKCNDSNPGLIAAGFSLPILSVEEAYLSALNRVGGLPCRADVKRLRESIRASPSIPVPPMRMPNRSDADNRGGSLDESRGVDLPLGLDQDNRKNAIVHSFVEESPRRAARHSLRRSKHLGAHVRRPTSAGTDLQPGGALKVPSTLRVVPQPVDWGQELRCSASGHAAGNETDDARCEGDVDDSFWLFVSEQVHGTARIPDRLNDPSRRIALARQAAHLLVTSRILLRAFVATPSLSRFSCAVRSCRTLEQNIMSFCSRMLDLEPPGDVMTMIVQHLLEVRNAQIAFLGFDSLKVFFSTPQASEGNVRHYCFAQLWLLMLKYCDAAAHVNSFWSVFNDLLDVNKKAILEDSRPEEKGVTATDAVNYSSIPLGKSGRNSPLSRWEEWCFDSIAAFGSLYFVRFECAADRNEEVQDISKISCVPNWPVVVSLLADLEGTIALLQPTVSYDTYVGRIRENFRRLVFLVAGKLWSVSEDVVLRAASLLHSFLLVDSSACSCTGSPSFLCQLRFPSDVRHREAYLESQLRSPCDYLCLLSWIIVSQSPSGSGKIPGKLIREASRYHHAASSSGDDKPFRHSVSMMLAVADGISPPPTEQGSENLFRDLLRSKAPSLDLATSGPFGMSEKSRWDAVVSAVGLRCKLLISRGDSPVPYIELLAVVLATSSRSMDVAFEGSNESLMKREALRLQRRLLQEVTLQVLSTAKDAISMMHSHLSDKEMDSVEHWQGVQASLDSTFVSLTKLMKHCGIVFHRVLSTVRSSAEACGTHVSFLSSVIQVADAVFDLCVLACRLVRTRSSLTWNPNGPNEWPRRGLGVLLRGFAESSSSGLIDLLCCNLMLGDGRSDCETRIAASRVLGRLMGLAAYCNVELPAKSPNKDSDKDTERTLDVESSIRRIGMDFCVAEDSGMKALNNQRRSKAEKATRLTGPESRISVLSPCRSAIAIEFWSVVLDKSWIDQVLTRNPAVEKMVVAAWIVLLCRPDFLATPQHILKLAWSLKAVCTKRPYLAAFFSNTSLSNLMQEPAQDLVHAVIRLRASTLAHALSVAVKPEMYPPGKLEVLLGHLRGIAGRMGPDLTLGNWTDWQGDESRSPKTALELRRLDLSFRADLQGLLFAMQCYLSSRCFRRGTVPHRRSQGSPRLVHGASQISNETLCCRSLDNVVDALKELHELDGSAHRHNDCVNDERVCPDVGAMYSRVVACVLRGLTHVELTDRLVGLKRNAAKFAKAVAEYGFESLLYRDLEDQECYAWIDRLGIADGAQSTTQACSEKYSTSPWRRYVLQVLIDFPLACNAFNSESFQKAARRMLQLVTTHEESGSSAARVSIDVKDSLHRLRASIPEQTSEARSQERPVLTSVDLCYEIGTKLETLLRDLGQVSPDGVPGLHHLTLSLARDVVLKTSAILIDL